MQHHWQVNAGVKWKSVTPSRVDSQPQPVSRILGSDIHHWNHCSLGSFEADSPSDSPRVSPMVGAWIAYWDLKKTGVHLRCVRTQGRANRSETQGRAEQSTTSADTIIWECADSYSWESECTDRFVLRAVNFLVGFWRNPTTRRRATTLRSWQV